MYITADEAAATMGLPKETFRNAAARDRKRLPHLILVCNPRFSLELILAWELANSVPGKAPASAATDAEEPRTKAPVQVRRRYEIAREQNAGFRSGALNRSPQSAVGGSGRPRTRLPEPAKDPGGRPERRCSLVVHIFLDTANQRL